MKKLFLIIFIGLITLGLLWVGVWLPISRASEVKNLNDKAVLYASGGKLLEAITFLEKAVKIDAKPTLLINLGDLYLKEGNFDKAVAVYRRAVEKDKGLEGEIRNRLGVFFYQNGDYSQALVELKRAAEVSLNNANIYNNLGMVLEANLLEKEAVAAYKRAGQLNSNLLSVHINLGRIYVGQRLFNEAIKEFKRVLEIDSSYKEAHNYLGKIYLNLGEKELAQKEFDAK